MILPGLAHLPTHLPSALPALARLPTPIAALPATLLAEVVDAAGNRVVGAVDAPIWVLPVGVAMMAMIPVMLLTLSGGSQAAAPVDPVIARAKRHADIRRRKRREALMNRMAVIVMETKSMGRGLFAQRALPAGEYLFDYEGETLDLAAYKARYSDGVSDYAVGIKARDGTMSFVDGNNELKSGLARFLNHDDRAPNVARRTLLDAPGGPRVLMYTTRAVQAGEELMWDYGAGYWAAHNGLVQNDEAGVEAREAVKAIA